MKLHRFFIAHCDFNAPLLRISDKPVVSQVRNVLKLKIGEQIVVCDGNLNEALIQITNLEKDFFEGRVLRVYKNGNEPEIRAVLYCSLLKRENFEWVTQKATEAGVAEIVPIIAKRTVKLNLKKERLEKIMQEAAEQSERGSIPILRGVSSLKEALHSAKSNTGNLFFDKSGEMPGGWLDVKKGRVGIFIGPEGGWEEEEILAAKEGGCALARLSALTFRAETAALLSVYAVSHLDSLFKASRSGITGN